VHHITAVMFPRMLGGKVVEADLHLDRAARALCGSCQIRQECLDYSLSHPENSGIWGGKDEKERRVLRRRRN
jgi:WhiB family transcriptional regulator, redox-sensing transcriptional regulator